MGKLYGMRCYQIGAMDRVEGGTQEWRDNITPKLNELGVMVYNPYKKPLLEHFIEESEETRKQIDTSKHIGDFDAVARNKPIRTVDLRMVDTSDFIILYLDLEQFPCGT